MSQHKDKVHLHRIHPIIFGGDPVAQENISYVSKLEHAELSTFWNNKILETTNTNAGGQKKRGKHHKPSDTPITPEFAERYLNAKLPEDFKRYLISGIEVEGEFQNQYLVLWKLDELVQLNEAYHVEDFAPNLLLFGSDGGEDAFAFDRTTMEVVQVPFIGMGYVPANKIANSFTDFTTTYCGEDWAPAKQF